jgi:hypothetical protein
MPARQALNYGKAVCVEIRHSFSVKYSHTHISQSTGGKCRRGPPRKLMVWSAAET